MADPHAEHVQWPTLVAHAGKDSRRRGIVGPAPRHHYSWLGPITGVVTASLRTHLELVRRGEPIPTTVLTPREDQVVKLIAEGHPSKTIADLLTISLKTVEHHRANILQKLGMRDRTELTRYAIRAGLIEP